jgi:hypothetical protein
MAWLSNNWIWILLGAAFIGLHLLGHGGHSGHNHHAAKGPPLEVRESEAGADADEMGPGTPPGHGRHGG